MKFGRQLRQARLLPWATRYIDYKSLKRVIKSLNQQSFISSGNKSKLSPDEQFMEQIAGESRRIEAFYLMKLSHAQARVDVLKNRISELNTLPKRTLSASKISLRHALHILAVSLTDLLAYTDINRTGFRKITKKFDKRHQSAGVNTSAACVKLLQSTSFADPIALRAMLDWCVDITKTFTAEDMPTSGVLQNLLDSVRVTERETRFTIDTENFRELFILAVRNREVLAVTELLPHLETLDFISAEGFSSLGIAAQNGDVSVMKILLENGASVSFPSSMDRTPLHLAVINGFSECVKLLVEFNSSIDSKDIELQTPLHYCIVRNDCVSARMLVSSNPEKIDTRNLDGHTPLALACQLGHVECLKVLLELGGCPDSFDWQSQVPLHHAAYHNHFECAQTLLNANANLYCFDVQGRSPLHAAARRASADIVELFLAHPHTQSNIVLLETTVDIEGRTVLHDGAAAGSMRTCELLLSREHVNPRALDGNGCSPTYHAFYNGHLACGDFLQEHAGVDVDAPDDDAVNVEDTRVLEHIVVGVPKLKRMKTSPPEEFKGGTTDDDLLCKVTFRIRAEVEEGRYLCICGETDSLGNWNPSTARRMKLVKETHVIHPIHHSPSDSDVRTWTLTMDMPKSSTPIEYKYLVMCESVLEVWEVLPQNRKICLDTHRVFVVDDGFFGARDEQESDSNASWTAKGWLVCDYQLHIRLGHVTAAPDLQRPPLRLDGVEKADLIEIGYHSSAHATQMRHVDLSTDLSESVVKFQLRPSRNGDLPAFSILFHVYSGSGFRLGTGAVMSCLLIRQMQGLSTVSLFGQSLSTPIGEVAFEFLVIRPFIHPNMTAVLNRCFSKSTKLIGHRGAGATKDAGGKTGDSKRIQTQENTILSFVTAAALGAEYIEFDVQLTKDRTAIIHHGFSLPLPTMSNIKIPIGLLSLEQFQSLRHDSIVKKTLKKKSSNGSFQHENSGRQINNETRHQSISFSTMDDFNLNIRAQSSSTYNEIRDSFPTLENVFKNVPSNVGYNIELKYPPEMKKARLGINFIGRNDYVDGILQCVFDHAKNRRVIFSSFDPDICLMASLKQPQYPVLLLTEAQGIRSWDPRACSIRAAVRFAASSNFLGICSFADPLLKAPKIVKTIKAAGLVLCTWSTANNNVENVKLSHLYGIDAVVVDRIAYISDELRKS